jgi:hypothetical protein
MKTAFNIEIVEQLETPCDLCNGIVTGIGIGLAVIALT